MNIIIYILCLIMDSIQHVCSYTHSVQFQCFVCLLQQKSRSNSVMIFVSGGWQYIAQPLCGIIYLLKLALYFYLLFFEKCWNLCLFKTEAYFRKFVLAHTQLCTYIIEWCVVSSLSHSLLRCFNVQSTCWMSCNFCNVCIYLDVIMKN